MCERRSGLNESGRLDILRKTVEPDKWFSFNTVVRMENETLGRGDGTNSGNLLKPIAVMVI